ncbi:hypothetical protein GOP47_0001816 [Adiantum capillus-veneris]|uniref:Uncharacterized protein n=1 Tax=Adiantum capillus-veneris TaxID=13818 RepID=A0A9D4ZNF8_ADICA|nr:hypothetical protein GOP47_0001816 [Adiantum capillus-veneris]
MQTRRKREPLHEDAAETAEKPRRGAKKRGRPVSSEEEKPEQAGPKKAPSRPRLQKTPSKKRTAGKKGPKSGKKGAPQAEPSTAQASTSGHESEMKEAENKIKVNRAPVLTMWVAAVAEREGYSFEEGLSFGKAIAGLMAQSKGRSLGVYEEPSEEKKEERKRKRKELERFPVFGMNVPGKTTQEGFRLAVQSGKPISPSSVAEYLYRSFGANHERAKGAMEDLANSFPEDEVGKAAYSLYERFRPTVPYGVKGWGAKGFLDIESMRGMRKE